MFYLVTATIIMHNMMVKERVRNYQVDNKNFYGISDGLFKQSSSDEDSVSSQSSIENSESTAVGNFDLSNVHHSTLKYLIIQRPSNKLYLDETSLRLQDAVKKNVFRKHFGDDRTLGINEFTEDYDPLIFNLHQK